MEGGCPRPEIDQIVNVVVLGRPEVGLLSGKVLFQRGRGIIVETQKAPDEVPERGNPAIVVYAARDGVYSFHANFTEAISDTRFYLLPASEPREMEKREYIRADMNLKAALTAERLADGAELVDVKIQLSASGFRWFGATEVDKGDSAWLRIRLPDDGGELVDIPARIVRVNTQPAGKEYSGQFMTIDQHQRDVLLRVVFDTRLRELGLSGEGL